MHNLLNFSLTDKTHHGACVQILLKMYGFVMCGIDRHKSTSNKSQKKNKKVKRRIKTHTFRKAYKKNFFNIILLFFLCECE